jgi:hypothetical protein
VSAGFFPPWWLEAHLSKYLAVISPGLRPGLSLYLSPILVPPSACEEEENQLLLHGVSLWGHGSPFSGCFYHGM